MHVLFPQVEEDAVQAKKALLERLEAAIHALDATEAASDKAAEAAGDAAADLDAQVQVPPASMLGWPRC